MRYTSARLTTGLLSLFLIIAGSACTKIDLSGGGKGRAQPPLTQSTQPPGTSMLGGGPQAQSPTGNGAPPLIEGEWEIDFTVPGGEPQIANVFFSQQDKVLVGEGTDQTGVGWQIQNGRVEGTNVAFSKMYVGVDPPRPPINYVGQLKYDQTPEYTGWLMEGTYSLQKTNGQILEGKWASNPLPTAEAQPEAQPGQPGPGGLIQGLPQAPPSAPVNARPANIGSDKPTDLSGKYHVSYQYNFKKIKGHMWLEHDGRKLGGHGLDTTTGEGYVIEAGEYRYPDISFARCYVKGRTGAKSTRKVLFRAKISSDSHLIIMKGETQFGGQWDAELARLR